MDLVRPVDPTKLLTLQQAAQRLAVSVDVLLKWNEHNILKPTITPTGEVGYREEQINQFLGIRQVTQSTSQSNQIPIVKHEHSATTNNYLQKDYVNLQHTKLESPNFSRTKSKYLSIGPSSAVLTLGIALVVILITQPAKIEFLLSEASNMGNALASQISGLNISGSTASTSPIQLKNAVASDKNLNNEGQAVLANKINALNAVSEKKSAKNGNQMTTALLGVNTHVNDKTSVTSFASSTTTSDSNVPANSVFDNSGNIKGKTTNTDLLATAIGVNGITQGDGTIKQVVNLNIPLTILTLSLLSLLFVFRRQPAYSTKKPNAAVGIDPHNFISDAEEQKILEVGQKTDGTVVLYFQGKEYSICKPELDSESDQFIERLMGLVATDVKEIDYDSFGDEEIRLSAPLSKLVTRLGFVGIKRDLFFPRTSKNRVLFRRYLTKQDLISMNLTTEQISNEFLSFTQS
jgi:hypothetical protein